MGTQPDRPFYAACLGVILIAGHGVELIEAVVEAVRVRCLVDDIAVCRQCASTFTKASRLLGHIKDTFRPKSPVTKNELLSRLRAVDLPVIDEIGVQFGTDTERMILFEVLDSRYEDMMPTIVTSPSHLREVGKDV